MPITLLAVKLFTLRYWCAYADAIHTHTDMFEVLKWRIVVSIYYCREARQIVCMICYGFLYRVEFSLPPAFTSSLFLFSLYLSFSLTQSLSLSPAVSLSLSLSLPLPHALSLFQLSLRSDESPRPPNFSALDLRPVFSYLCITCS